MSLSDTLEQFRLKVNADARLESLLRGWEPKITVEAIDTGRTQCLRVHNSLITAITSTLEEATHVVRLRASEHTLIAVFAGKFNPIEAFLDGELEIYATERDQVKLDAISLVLWGS